MVFWPNRGYEQPVKINLLIMVMLDGHKHIYSERSATTRL